MPESGYPAEVLSAYALELPLDVVPLGSARGFSGARFWRIRASGGEYCLRQWPPEHPDRTRLQFIHTVLVHAKNSGVGEVAAPLAARDGQTFVQHGGCFWELTKWIPGAADESDSPPQARVAAALAVLGRFHRETAVLSTSRRPDRTSPGLAERAAMLADLQSGGLEELNLAVTPQAWPAGDSAAATAIVRELLRLVPPAARIVQPRLAAAVREPVVLQPCIRDIWRAHVFFEENRVSGIVDFGAMRQECAAGDVARLLGSYAADDRVIWDVGLAAYQQTCELSSAEQRLVRVFDETSVLLSGINWIRWIYEQRRQFDDRAAIIRRLEVTRQRLVHLIEHGGRID